MIQVRLARRVKHLLTRHCQAPTATGQARRPYHCRIWLYEIKGGLRPPVTPGPGAGTPASAGLGTPAPGPRVTETYETRQHLR